MHTVLQIARQTTALQQLLEHHFAPIALSLVVASKGLGQCIGFVAEFLGLLHQVAHFCLEFASLLNPLKVGLLDALAKKIELGSERGEHDVEFCSVALL